LSSDPNPFLPEPVVGPDNFFSTPNWFLEGLRILADMPCPVPKPDLKFDVSM
jgi:hypothetical protein